MSPELKAQIEKEAKEYSNFKEYNFSSQWDCGKKEGYIAGATKYASETSLQLKKNELCQNSNSILRDENSQLKARIKQWEIEALEISGINEENHYLKVDRDKVKDENEQLKARIVELEEVLGDCAEELNNLMAKNNMPVHGAAPSSDNLNGNVYILDRARNILNTKTK